jgi:hypothetical protein
VHSAQRVEGPLGDDQSGLVVDAFEGVLDGKVEVVAVAETLALPADRRLGAGAGRAGEEVGGAAHDGLGGDRTAGCRSWSADDQAQRSDELRLGAQVAVADVPGAGVEVDA